MSLNQKEREGFVRERAAKLFGMELKNVNLRPLMLSIDLNRLCMHRDCLRPRAKRCLLRIEDSYTVFQLDLCEECAHIYDGTEVPVFYCSKS